MQIQQDGEDLVIRLSQKEASTRGITVGDEVEIIKVDHLAPEQFKQLLDTVMREHQGTLEYLQNK